MLVPWKVYQIISNLLRFIILIFFPSRFDLVKMQYHARGCGKKDAMLGEKHVQPSKRLADPPVRVLQSPPGGHDF